MISTKDNNDIGHDERSINNNEAEKMVKEKENSLNPGYEDEEELNSLLDTRNKSRLEAFFATQNKSSSASSSSSFVAQQKPFGAVFGSVSVSQ